MASNSYTLWCINQASTAGNILVYQDSGNVSTSGNGTLATLAWMCTGANPGTQIQFEWSVSADLAWFDQSTPATQAILPSSTGTQVTLSKNSYGYLFSTPTTGSTGQLTIQTDSTIPAVNHLLAGIGMDGAGTFAYPALPNLQYTFTPAGATNLRYWVSFGYNGSVNQALDLSNLNHPQSVVFPYGVTTMTAIYQIDGTWSVSNGPPPQSLSCAAVALPADTDSALSVSPTQVLVYRPGVGLV